MSGAPTPLPFGGDATPGCRKAHSAGYVRGAAALAIICFITDFFGTLLVGLGLRSTDPNKKYKYYRVAIYSLAVAVLALFLAVVIYPTSVSKEMATGSTLDGGRVQRVIFLGDMDFDNDGIMDHLDDDDDNGIPDELDGDDDDQDNDGIPDSEDTDDDNDGIPDAIDNDDDNDGISDELDGDDDGDGIADDIDDDDDNDGIPDHLDLSGDEREWEFGFGFGSSVFCLVFLVLSLVLLICDRESEEIFYKEREAEEEEEEKEEA